MSNLIKLFNQVLDGMEDNNDVNNANYSDWDMADDAIKHYTEKHEVKCLTEEEETELRSAISAVINSNGEDIDWAKEQINNFVSRFEKK